ncbi:hypothetical protein PHYPSEUDO_004821 [Phytophthora pseudosyringae]|uniref:Uncharacterized protein n=1 Tax=Phytophthora pseudosyringae TaxID=221518 RepID=A0A8T1VNK2_9STRA|nr:hypothetical protein PHYPSEUDO_004821 [Phytophthora pseudosyringae]
MVYDLVCCVCAGIRPKCRSVLLARWNNLKHKSNQDANFKIKLKLTPKSSPVFDPQPVSVTENSTHSTHGPEIQQAIKDHVSSPPQHPPTPLATSTELGHSERTLDSSPSIEDATTRETSDYSNNAGGMAPSGDDLSVGISTPPTITDEHINMLRTLANSIPNSNSKWEYI